MSKRINKTLQNIFTKDIIMTDIIKGQSRYVLPDGLKLQKFNGYKFKDSIYIKKPKNNIKNGMKLIIDKKIINNLSIL